MTEYVPKKRLLPWIIAFFVGLVAMGITIDILDIKSKALASGLMILPMVFLAMMARNAMFNAKKQGAAGDPVRRYIFRMITVSFAYVGSLFLASELIEKGGEVTPLAVVLALVPGVAVSGYFWAIGRFIVEQKDEFQRLLIIRQSLVATALALSLASIWGFLENFQLVQHIDAFWWPIVWFFGLGVGAVVNKIQLGTTGETL